VRGIAGNGRRRLCLYTDISTRRRPPKRSAFVVARVFFPLLSRKRRRRLCPTHPAPACGRPLFFRTSRSSFSTPRRRRRRPYYYYFFRIFFYFFDVIFASLSVYSRLVVFSAPFSSSNRTERTRSVPTLCTRKTRGRGSVVGPIALRFFLIRKPLRLYHIDV